MSAKAILEASGGWNHEVVAVEFQGKLVDTHTTLPTGTAADDLKIIRKQDPKALPVIRHSSAHVMADAVQRLFPGTKVAFGPATDNGFFYDYLRPNGAAFTEEDLRVIEEEMHRIMAANAPFVRKTISADEGRAMLTKMNETFKLEHLEKLASMGEAISIYQHGDWVDLCEGPHVPSTKFLEAFKLTTVSSAYWRGDERNPMLQRIYGTAFSNPKELREYLKQIEEAKLRDHRKLGKELELIAFHPWAPASPFFLPRGASIYNNLVAYVRKLYEAHGYEEVITPQNFDKELFLTSGHLPAYSENMYLAMTAEDVDNLSEVLHKCDGKGNDKRTVLMEGVRYAQKPMNCPGHALMFGMEKKSYRDLPYRIADFGRLHRFERSGAISGMTRVRTFAQDDAHIFCTLDQVQQEIERFSDLVMQVYRDFGFTEVRVVLATRPEERLGSDDVWDKSESALASALKNKGIEFETAEGEGAFYGPKIEYHLKDALGRSWQLGTMQCDFNLPERFDLNYVGEDNTLHRPVMLHRAILGSIERFFAVLIEHVGGAFPTWLAPEQVILLSVSEKSADYANEVVTIMKGKGIRALADNTGEKLGAKIRLARNKRIPYLAVVGEKEAAERTLSVRSRDENKELGSLTLDAMVERLMAEHTAPSFR